MVEAVHQESDATREALGVGFRLVSDTIVSEGPYLGPATYELGVQEIAAGLATVDAAVGSVDVTVATGSAAITAAVAASAASITASVVAEAANTRGLINDLLGPRAIGLWTLIYWPVGGSLWIRTPSFTRQYIRSSGGTAPDNLQYIVGGNTYNTTLWGNVSFSRPDTFRIRYSDQVTVTQAGTVFTNSTIIPIF